MPAASAISAAVRSVRRESAPSTSSVPALALRAMRTSFSSLVFASRGGWLLHLSGLVHERVQAPGSPGWTAPRYSPARRPSRRRHRARPARRSASDRLRRPRPLLPFVHDRRLSARLAGRTGGGRRCAGGRARALSGVGNPLAREGFGRPATRGCPAKSLVRQVGRMDSNHRPADYEPAFATSGNRCERASDLRSSSRSRWVSPGRFPCTRGPNAAPQPVVSPRLWATARDALIPHLPAGREAPPLCSPSHASRCSR